MRKLVLFAAVYALLAPPALAAEPVIDPARLAEHVKILASDAKFEASGPVTARQEPR